MKDNLEDLLGDILEDVDVDLLEDEPSKEPSLEDLLGDVLSEIDVEEAPQEEDKTITASAMSEVVVDLEEEEIPSDEGAMNIVPDEQAIDEVVQNEVKSKKVKTKKTKVEKKTEKKKNKVLLGFLGILLVSAIAFGTWFAWDTFLNFKTINVFEHIKLIYEGSEGAASVDFEITDFKEDEDDSVKELLDMISFDYDKSENLSNQDAITVTVKVDEDLESFLKENKLKLDPLTEEYVVDGLVDARSFEVFLDTIISLEGFNGQATATISNNDFKSYTEDEIKILKKIKYSIDKEKDLSNDDIITINAEVSDELSKELNIMNLRIEETSIEFFVSTLITLPESIDEVPDSATLQEEALAKATSDYEKQNQTYTNFEVEYACFTNDPQNVENYTDYFESHPYTGASLMYIISIENKTGTVGEQYFSDNYGYTNIQVKDDAIDRDELKLMSPFQDFASTSEIKTQLELNGFKCTRE